MKKIVLSVIPIVAAGFLLSAPARASVVDFTFTDTISSAGTPGIAVGDTFTLNLFADNGGSSTLGQTWTIPEILGFTIQAGTYSATYSTPYPGGSGFTTDATGHVVTASFFGTSATSNNTDNFGSFIGDVVFGNAEFDDSLGRVNNIAAGGFTNASEWTVAVAAVPEPSTWAMMILGFLGLGVMAYRKKSGLRLA
jgi:hypothetical protein